ncbi:MAG: di-trans,poly-cis-decaprenylcistransferase [Chlamydiales bacterium]|nr:di-trans,poly-cis-decaprenylcistransferase [Chlamydiales bacterium]
MQLTKIFSEEQLVSLERENIPRHVAIIMDGNRRWAKKHFLPIKYGHVRGINTLTQIVEAAAEIGIDILTVYSFSTENWNRSIFEVNALMELFKQYLVEKRQVMKMNGVRLSVIGDTSKFSKEIIDEIDRSIDYTKDCTRIQLVLALNYGARDELKRAVIRMIEAIEEGKLSKDGITEETISSYLDTHALPDPDLLIRTSGERRVSNFLLWQISYSEIYYTDKLWPEFTQDDLLLAMLDYQTRYRRKGK